MMSSVDQPRVGRGSHDRATGCPRCAFTRRPRVENDFEPFHVMQCHRQHRRPSPIRGQRVQSLDLLVDSLELGTTSGSRDRCPLLPVLDERHLPLASVVDS
jgi:hypothetical protein